MVNCLVVDDEPIARDGLMDYISQIEFLYPVASCKSAIEAAGWMQKQPVDLVFLDIQMPRLSGIDFIKSVTTMPLVVFTTAYPEYAIEGYELDILDYLLKPISFTRFLKAALKAQEFLTLKSRVEQKISPDFFFIKCNQKIEKITIADVLYIEGMSNYIIVHTKLKKYIAYLTFKGIEEKLPEHLFIRVHKSFLVSINAIQSFDASGIRLETVVLPISKNYRDEIISKIGDRFFKR